MNKQLLLAAILIAPFYSHADDCRYSKDYDFSADAASLESLRLDVGAGKLIVTGNSARNEVSVVATACANTSERLEELDLNHRARDSELLVRTERHRSRSFLSWLSFGNNYSYINVEVTMPSDLALDVDDGSGSVEISNVSSLSLKDGSGSIYIFGVSGIVSIEDGSGPIRIRDSNEVAIIDDGSGDISIENIHSNVNIRHDGSGGIRIRDVAGDVEIGDAGSGSVDVSGVAGVYNFRDN